VFDPKELLNVLTGGNPASRAETAAAAANDALERGKQVATDAANQTAAAVSSALGKAQDRLQGTEAADYVGKAKEIVRQNPVGTTAALGGLVAILLLDAEIQHPATIEEIAKGVGSSKELALQVYAAAHLVASSEPEKRFLKDLAAALTLDPSLIAHFNQTALMHTASAQ
jgi:ElaB/YqjD/DUF883 family membrane-anchored ribosome-binding protein